MIDKYKCDINIVCVYITYKCILLHSTLKYTTLYYNIIYTEYYSTMTLYVLYTHDINILLTIRHVIHMAVYIHCDYTHSIKGFSLTILYYVILNI